MSKKVVLALVLVGLAAACAKKEPEVVTTPAAVQPEPVFQGKYGAN
jgi:type IV pilus biogenesis protein CpaD/CtpE